MFVLRRFVCFVRLFVLVTVLRLCGCLKLFVLLSVYCFDLMLDYFVLLYCLELVFCLTFLCDCLCGIWASGLCFRWLMCCFGWFCACGVCYLYCCSLVCLLLVAGCCFCRFTCCSFMVPVWCRFGCFFWILVCLYWLICCFVVVSFLVCRLCFRLFV